MNSNRATYRDQPVCRFRFMSQNANTLHANAVAAHGIPGKDPLPMAPGVIPDGNEAIQMAPYLPLVRYRISWPYENQHHGARSGDLPGWAKRLNTPTKPSYPQSAATEAVW